MAPSLAPVQAGQPADPGHEHGAMHVVVTGTQAPAVQVNEHWLQLGAEVVLVVVVVVVV